MNSEALKAAFQNKKKRAMPSSTGEATTSATSSERTVYLRRSASESSHLGSPPVNLPPPRSASCELRETQLPPITEMGVNEGGSFLGQEADRELSYPEAAEMALAGLNGMANFVTDGLAKFQQLSAELEAAKTELVAKAKATTAAEAKAKKAAGREAKALAATEEANKKASDLEAEVAGLKARLTEEHEKMARAAASQGGMLRAFAERIFRSTYFGGLVAQLVGAMSTSITNAVIDLIADDYPDLDKAKYGYEVCSEEEMLQDYAGVLVEHTAKVPVVERLAQHKSLLSERSVRNCPVDKDEKLEAIIAGLPKDPAGDTAGGRSAEAVIGGEADMEEVDPNKSAPDLSDASHLVNEISKLRRAVEMVELDASNWRKRADNIGIEAKIKLRVAQEKLDEAHAKYLELDDKYQEAVAGIKTFKDMTEEHAEYEHLIRKSGRLTIPETHEKVKEVRARLKRYVKEYGKDSLQVGEQEDELLKLGALYRTVLNRLPKLKEWMRSKKAPLHSVSQD